MRICSLLPSATEIVFALGLGDRLVAVTHECDYPPEATRLPVITRSALDHAGSGSREIHTHVSRSIHAGSSLYELDQALLKELDPDLILTQELCAVCAVAYDQVRKAVRLLEGERRVVSLEPTSVGGILETIERVGEVAALPDRAAEVVRQLRQRIERVTAATGAARARPRVLALEWLDPPFVGGHWVPEMVRLAGGSDGLGRQGAPSREIAWAEIAAYAPEVVVLMPCGFGLERTIAELGRATLPDEWRHLPAVRAGQVYAVDGSAYFNRPGPRIVEGLEILAGILQPDRVPPRAETQAWRRLGDRGLDALWP